MTFSCNHRIAITTNGSYLEYIDTAGKIISEKIDFALVALRMENPIAFDELVLKPRIA